MPPNKLTIMRKQVKDCENIIQGEQQMNAVKTAVIEKLENTIDIKNLRIEELESQLEEQKGNVAQWKEIAEESRKETKCFGDSNYRLCIERNKSQKLLQSLQKYWAELSAHHKAQMMSVYYLLDTCMHHGTHTEKRVSMQHLKLTIEKLIANGDDLRNTLTSGLPF